MRVQVCSKCKQPRKGHICPLWNESSVSSKINSSEDSMSQSPQVLPSPPPIAHQPQSRSTDTQIVYEETTRRPSIHSAFEEVKQASPIHTTHCVNPVAQNNMQQLLNGPTSGPQVIEYSGVRAKLFTRNCLYIENPHEKKMKDYEEMSETLMQRAAQTYKEDRAQIILYVTSMDPYQNAVKRFVSEPLKAETSSFQMMDRSALELIETCKSCLTASREELLEILNERSRELAESRKEVDQLKLEMSKLPSFLH
ncbi:hypothetical protein K7432_001644 [Basidiobolus ranarum]|uniref:Uncharacterized protein n=1 Tax=Basidiobolus ranarum TaxID=34480 RepID=A0ABR2W952_9FUNG